MVSKLTVDVPVVRKTVVFDQTNLPVQKNKWTYGRWLASTFCFVALMTVLTVWINWRLDVLGLFGRGEIQRYGLDRYSTYAMSYRFIPEHFDGLLLGNSLTTNWDTSLIRGYRVFNCSMRGSNFSEENLIAQNVLAHSNPKMLIILLHPSFTANHGRLTAYMTPDEYWSSLGSVQMLTIYSQMVLERLAGPNTKVWTFQHRAFPFGGETFRVAESTGSPGEPTLNSGGDPVALQEFKDLVQTAHKRHIKIYFLLPPTFSERWQIYGKETQAYYDRMLKLATPSDRVIDLNDGSLRNLTERHADFPDYVHLSLPAAHRASELMAQRIAESEKSIP